MESLLRARLRRPRPPGGGDRLPRPPKQCGARFRARSGGESVSRRPDSRQRMDESKARSMTARPDPPSPSLRRGKREDGPTADGESRRRQERRREDVRSKGSGRPAHARRPPPGGRRKRSPAPAGRAQAARPSAAPCQARRPAGRGVWERRAWRAACSSSRTRHDKPGATGEDACTRDPTSRKATSGKRSGGPSPARSGGTTDHAAERNAGSGQAGSVTERSDGASPWCAGHD